MIRRFRAYQELLLVVSVGRVLDEGEGGHGTGLNQLRGQENGRGSQQLELLLLQPVRNGEKIARMSKEAKLVAHCQMSHVSTNVVNG